MFGIWGLITGVLLFLFGIFSIFFFPSSMYHQEGDLAVGGIVLGLIALGIGAVLIFM